MKRIDIARKACIAPERFVAEHMAGVGLPVVVTDAMDAWPALSKWSFQFLRESYGRDFATASAGLYSEVAQLTTVGAYVEFLENPGRSLPGFWISERDGRPLRAKPAEGVDPLYLMGWEAFRKHPELYSDIEPAPYFIADWVHSLDAAVRDILEATSGREFWSLYVGPKGTLSRLHQDFWRTHSCLSQVRGSKRAILFSPDDTPFLYDGKVDPEHPDLVQFGLFAEATAYECVLGPSEVLYIPPDWWHCVRALDNSITVSHNFFNGSNASDYLRAIFAKLPALARAVELTMGRSGVAPASSARAKPET